MKHDKIDEEDKAHLKTLIKWLVAEIHTAGGDGDALWYSERYDILDIYDFLEELTGELTYPGGQQLDWELSYQDGSIFWGHREEGLVVINNTKLYNEPYDWYQCVIKY